MTDAVKKLYEAARALSAEEQIQLGEMLAAANDDMTVAKREAIDALIDEGMAAARAGRVRDVDELLSEL